MGWNGVFNDSSTPTPNPGNGQGGWGGTGSPGGVPPSVSSYVPDPRVTGLAQSMAQSRQADMTAGQSFANKYFGYGNPDIASIENTEKQRMLGLNTGEVQAMRDQGTSQINSQLGTGLSQLRGINAANHVVGGAAAGTAMPLLNNANQQQAQLANNINLANIQRQNTALGQFQNTVTGERAGGLNTAFGIAGLGAADRSGAQQTVLGNDWVDWANRNLGSNTGPNGTGGGGGFGSNGQGIDTKIANIYQNAPGNIAGAPNSIPIPGPSQLPSAPSNGNKPWYDPSGWSLPATTGGSFNPSGFNPSNWM